MICLPLVAIIISATARIANAVAVVRLTQETPCLPAQSCRLRCSVVSGTNDNGLVFHRNVTFVVTCPIGRDSCRSDFPVQYNHTQVDYSTSYLDIRSFDASRDAGTWSCSDGFSGTPSSLQVVYNVAVTRLTQETPCLSGQSCRLKCSVVAGVNDKGLHFYRDSTVVVVCLQGRDSCRSSFPGLFHLTQEDYNTSYVDIVTFDPSNDAATWICSDGLNGPRSYLPVIHNVLPTGSLTWGSTCVSGRVTSPGSLSCSGLSPGTSPANLTITDSSNQTVASSQTGSVTWTVTRGGQASCFVTWSAVPSFPLNITTIQCDVQVVANVAISVRNTPGQDKVVTCQAEGHPDTYTFQPWLQSWGGQEVRTVTGSQQGGQYNLTLTSYQDTGTYTCTVDNGVLDTSGQVMRRHMNIMVTVDGPPILPLPIDPPIVAGEDGEPVRLYRSLYASPDLVNHTWFFNSTDVTSLIPGATTNRNRDLVLLPVHGITVTTEGTVVSLTLTVSQQYSGLYRLQACNTIGCSSTTVTLVIASAPSPPESLSAKSSTDSVELSWTPGFAGGDFFQWFHVQYRRQDSQEGQWSDVSTADNRSSSDRTPVTVTVQGLLPDTSYVFRVRAQSSKPRPNLSSYTTIYVKTDSVNGGGYTAPILAAAVVVTAVLASAVTLATTCVALRFRRSPVSGPDGRNTSAVYQNVAYRGNETLENLASSQGRTPTAGPPLPKEEGAYSDLDPAKRDPPHDPSTYQGLAQSGRHGNQQSRVSGDRGNQTYTSVQVESPYATPYDVTR